MPSDLFHLLPVPHSPMGPGRVTSGLSCLQGHSQGPRRPREPFLGTRPLPAFPPHTCSFWKTDWTGRGRGPDPSPHRLLEVLPLGLSPQQLMLEARRGGCAAKPPWKQLPRCSKAAPTPLWGLCSTSHTHPTAGTDIFHSAPPPPPPPCLPLGTMTSPVPSHRVSSLLRKGSGFPESKTFL